MQVILLRTAVTGRTVLCTYVANDDLKVTPEMRKLAEDDGLTIQVLTAHYISSQQDLADEISLQCAPMSDP